MDIGGLIGGISGIVQNLQTFGNMDLQNRAQIQNAQMTMHNWQRDDNAVQRRVADLKKAGLSPTLAAGSAASTSQPIKAEAPQMEGLEKAPQAVMQMMKMAQDFRTSQEQAKTLHAQAKSFLTNARKNTMDADIKQYDLGLAQSLGVPYASGTYGQIAKTVKGLLGNLFTRMDKTDTRSPRTKKSDKRWENNKRSKSLKEHRMKHRDFYPGGKYYKK